MPDNRINPKEYRQHKYCGGPARDNVPPDTEAPGDTKKSTDRDGAKSVK